MHRYDPRHEQASSPGTERSAPAHGIERSADRIEHMHDVLSDPFRRAILYHLQEGEEPAGVREVASQVLDWCRNELQIGGERNEPQIGGERNELQIGDGADADRDRAWLLQTHVKPMHEFGVITYDSDRDTISLPDDVSITITPHWDE